MTSCNIKGSILIGAYYTDLNNPLEKQNGYFDKPWQWDKIKANQDKITLIWGDDDPYIPQAEFEFIAKQLDPTQIKIHGGGRFTEQNELPELLEYVGRSY